MIFKCMSLYIVKFGRLDQKIKRMDTLADSTVLQDDTKKRELLKNPTKIEEIQEKIIIDRN